MTRVVGTRTSLALALSVAAMALPECSRNDARARFDEDVAPVLRRRCSAPTCHGVLPGTRSPRLFQFPTEVNGGLSEQATLDAAYAAARQYIDTTEIPEISSLLRKPLPREYGGLAHAGGTGFVDTIDTAYLAVRGWIAMEHGGGEDGDPSTLTPGQRFFAREVQPRLASAMCTVSTCHGPGSPIPLIFDPGVNGVFGVAATLSNYTAALSQLSLGGWPEQSRLARKPLLDPATFLPHRGGNGIASFPATMTDPLPRAIVAWARLEREARTGGAPEHAVRGVVFVGGPVGPARVVEHDAFTPGSDLYELSPAMPGGTVRNLTASLHAMPADIREPVVNDAGTRVAFSMRVAAAEGTALWELDLATGQGRALTTPTTLPNGSPSHDLAPAYGPDGRVWFVSTRAGTLAEHGDGVDTDIYVVGLDGVVRRRTNTPSPELTTTFFRSGIEAAGTLGFTAIRRLGDGYKGVVYLFPPDLHIQYREHFGILMGDDVTYRTRELPDGNYVSVLLDRDAVWGAGALVIVDRDMGAEMPESLRLRSSLPRYHHAVSYLGPYGSHDEAVLDPYGLAPAVRRTVSDGAYRDPSPLPDGRLLVSYASGRIALRDPTVAPDFGLYALTLTRDAVTGEASVASRERLVDLPGLSETAPVAVYQEVPAPDWGVIPSGTIGVLNHGGIPVAESILGRPAPFGARVLRTDVRSVRILGWIPETSDPTTSTRVQDLYPEQRRSGATPHMPARILAELPVETDGTFQAALEAGTAFRLQFLDARGMAVGAQHNRWFDIQGGQELRQGAGPVIYDDRCSGCHGSRTGLATDAFGQVDVVASASHSLARFVNNDRDRPRDPPMVNAATLLPADWRADVLPLIRRSCTAGCHDSTTRGGGLDLEPRPTAQYDTTYEALVALGASPGSAPRYVDVTGTSARGSFLVERMLGQELDAPRSIDGAVPHRGSPPLSDAEVQTVVRWIESGGLYCTQGCP